MSNQAFLQQHLLSEYLQKLQGPTGGVLGESILVKNVNYKSQ